MADQAAIASFQRYLRMRTDHPSPDYGSVGPYLQEYASASGFTFQSVELVPGHPCYVLSWPGSDASAPSIVLLSHMDVVPVDAEKWTQDPWGGELVEGKVFGRGAQDMKCVGVQYLEACARLKASGTAPLRSVHLVFVPDEEVGGSRGIKPLLAHPVWASLNPGFLMDEGLASPSGAFSVFYGERKIWWVRLKATGPAGHGSRFVPNTAVQQLNKVLARIEAFHEEQRAALAATCSCGKQLGDFTTANVTMLSAGNPNPATPLYNVIPTEAFAGVDIRIPATVNLEVFKATLDAWCAVEGGGVTWEPLAQVCGEGKAMVSNPTEPIEGPDAHWFGVFKGALGAAGYALNAPSIFPAATDSRWVRLMSGTPCLGFSPMRNTPILLHDHDEFLSCAAFLEGIAVYTQLLPALFNDASYRK
jgi:aminoacylase